MAGYLGKYPAEGQQYIEPGAGSEPGPCVPNHNNRKRLGAAIRDLGAGRPPSGEEAWLAS